MKLKGLDKFMDAIDDMERTINSDVKDVFKDNALFMEGQAKSLTPVDTGHLRRSITTEDRSSGNKIEYEVHTGAVEYAEFVEVGTSSQAAQPYFNPSFQITERYLKDDLDQLMKKGMN